MAGFGVGACAPELERDLAEEAVELAADVEAEARPEPLYTTYGAHNPPEYNEQCTNRDCTYPRKDGEPEDPLWPEYWQSDWNMYRVYNRYAEFPPPYPGKPPSPLADGVDYQTSKGTSYYDSTYEGQWGKRAMLENYTDFCLPIFPMENGFSCQFVSVGEKAFFFADDDRRPDHVPEACLFSPLNYAPARDFVSHLPYSAGDSARIGEGGQGYSFWVSAVDGRVLRVGASPDQTGKAGILFGYGFERTDDGAMRPHSFYFSGYPLPPADAPMVSQNYVGFGATQPDASIWEKAESQDIDALPVCNLFAQHETDSEGKITSVTPTTELTAPTWASIGRWKG